MFFDVNVFHVKKDGFSVDLIPERMRGDVATFDIKDKKGKVIVEVGRGSPRATCACSRRAASSAGRATRVPDGAGHRQDVVDQSTGEMLVPCNTNHHEEVLKKLGGGRQRDRDDLHQRPGLWPVRPTRCASTRPATVWKRWSRSTG
jgi:DNA-directed RNA polymerase subunit beta